MTDFLKKKKLHLNIKFMVTGKFISLRWVVILVFFLCLFSTGIHQVTFSTSTTIVKVAFDTDDFYLTVLTIIYQFTCLLAIPITNYLIDQKGILITGWIAAILLLASYWIRIAFPNLFIYIIT